MKVGAGSVSSLGTSSILCSSRWLGVKSGPSESLVVETPVTCACFGGADRRVRWRGSQTFVARLESFGELEQKKAGVKKRRELELSFTCLVEKREREREREESLRLPRKPTAVSRYN